MTSDEIVKALRHCATVDGSGCYECPAKSEFDCEVLMKTEAADLIERLTAENADLRKEIEWKDMVIAIAQRKQAKAEAERDAALADLADARSCKTCKYACDTRDCSSCKSKTCKCRECHLDKNAWKWRGLPEAPEEGEKA